MISIRTRRPGPAPLIKAPSVAPADEGGDRRTAPNWRTTENQTLQEAARIAGVSVAGLYRAQAAGTLKFKRLLGRVVVPTESLAKLVDSADEWAPSSKGREARAARRAQELAA